MGRSRRGKVAGTTTKSTDLIQRVARTGANPRRLRSVLPPRPKAPSGRFNARGRGAKIAATLPRSPEWSVDRAGTRVRARRVAVKARIVKMAGKQGAGRAHLSYLERDGVTREGERGRLYSTFSDDVDREAFIERGAEDRHQFRFIVAPEDGVAYDDLKPFTRDLMAKVEADLETTLDWVAVDHHDTGHPHTHIVVRGITEDGKILNIAGDYIAHGIRARASEVVTRDLGPQTEREVQRHLEIEIGAERLTDLDRTLIGRAEKGVVDLSTIATGGEAARSHQQLLTARARQLERMKLATREAPLRWSIAPEAEPVLRAMGERGDIIKTMHRAMERSGAERAPELYALHDGTRLMPTIVGRVVARGLADELAERRYVVIDGIDGRSHYLDIGEANERLPTGSIVRVSPTSTEARQVDRTVAEVASASRGRYSADLHLAHDRTATPAFAEAHVRRLEALRRAAGSVERSACGTWTIPPDHLDRARAYEVERAKARPVQIETLSIVPIERQLTADAPTWLDRQIVHDIEHERAAHGFGRDVRRAMVQRQQWLVDQGLMKREGNEVVYRTNILDTLKRRELQRAATQLAGDLGLAFAEPIDGQRIEGTYRRPVDLTSGRYALIERSHEFTLVPWRPVLDQHIDQHVSGITRGASIDWSFGRQRGGPSI